MATRYSINDGLSSNYVNCIWQSSAGFLWIGTENGLQRFDGSKFIEIYFDRGNQTLPSLPVHQIVGGENSKMWLRMGHVIGQYDPKTYTFKGARIPDDTRETGKYMKRLYASADGTIYLVREGYDILIYNHKKNAFIKEPGKLSVPESWKPRSVTEDRKTGDLYIPGIKGVGIYHARTKKFYHPGYNPLKIDFLIKTSAIGYSFNVMIDKNGRVWISTWEKSLKLYSYQPGHALKTHNLSPALSDSYYELAGVKETVGNIWAFGSNLLNVYDPDTGKFIIFSDYRNINYGIRFNVVQQVFADRDHNIWIATDNGLYLASIVQNHIRNGNIINFQKSDILSATDLPDNRIVFSSWGNGIETLAYDKRLVIRKDSSLSGLIYKNYDKKDSNFKLVWSVLRHSNGRDLWLSCQSGRLIHYDQMSKKAKFYNPSVFGESTIRQVLEDKNQNLWFITQFGRVIRKPLNGDFKIVYELNKTVISKMMLDSHNMLWLSTGGEGLIKLDTRTGKLIEIYGNDGPVGKRLTSNHVVTTAQLSDHIYAIACNSNLDILDTKTNTIRNLSSYQGLPQRIIYTMEVDNQRKLWLSTNGGLCKYDPSTGVFRMYDQKDGLISTSLTGAPLNVSAKLKNGHLIFSGGNSFVIFNPEKMRDVARPKNVTITDFKLFNDFLPLDLIKTKKGIELAHDQNSVTVMFASLSYIQGEKLEYYYQLEGATKEWVKAERNLVASFASLSPGKYKFLVKCVNSEGLWSAATTSLDIYIRPAFYQTWWFLIIVGILFSLPVYFIYRLRIKRLMAVQMLRQKVARDLHDDMGSTLTSINILSEVASHKIDKDPHIVADYLSRISATSWEMMDAMDDIVWSIKPDNDTLPKVIARMREYAANMLEAKEVNYLFDTEEKFGSITIDMEARRNLFLIFKEALNNILKYAEANVVKIKVRSVGSYIKLVIEDDGKGFDQSIENNGNGLSNMRKRAEMIGGSFTIKSIEKQGTFITILIPVAR